MYRPANPEASSQHFVFAAHSFDTSLGLPLPSFRLH